MPNEKEPAKKPPVSPSGTVTILLAVGLFIAKMLAINSSSCNQPRTSSELEPYTPRLTDAQIQQMSGDTRSSAPVAPADHFTFSRIGLTIPIPSSFVVNSNMETMFEMEKSKDDFFACWLLPHTGTTKEWEKEIKLTKQQAISTYKDAGCAIDIDPLKKEDIGGVEFQVFKFVATDNSSQRKFYKAIYFNIIKEEEVMIAVNYENPEAGEDLKHVLATAVFANTK